MPENQLQVALIEYDKLTINLSYAIALIVNNNRRSKFSFMK